MKKGKVWKERLLSIMLVFVLAMANVTPAGVGTTDIVKAESISDDMGAQKEEIISDEVKTENQESISDEIETENESIAAPAEDVAAQPQAETGKAMTVTLTVQGYGYLKFSPVQVALPDTYKTYAQYGLSGITDPGYYTPIHAMAQYCEDNGIDPSTAIKASDTGFTNFLDVDDESNWNTFMMLCINHQIPGSDTVASYQLQGNDAIQIYDWFWTSNSTYAYFTQENWEGTVDSAAAVQLQALDMSSMGSGSSPENIEVYALNTDGTALTSDQYSATKTDAAGNATVTFHQEGTYTLAARRLNDNGENELNYPTSSITVSKVPEISDEEIVQNAKDALDLGKLTSVTENLLLPNSGANGASIEWATSDDTTVKTDGTVIRTPQTDKKVTLTATISRNQATAAKIFEVTVKGYYDLLNIELSAGGLEFSPSVFDYTVYVTKDTSELKISATVDGKSDSHGGVSYFKINGKWKFLDSKKATTTDSEKVQLTADETVIPIEITRNVIGKGLITATTTVTVKKAVNPGEDLAELPSSWPQHLGGADNNAVSKTEVAAENTNLVWESFAEGEGSWGSWYAGTPILVDGKLYAARNGQIQKMNASTGALEQSTPLKSALSFYSYITYGGGKIFVPLGNGSIQCFDAVSLKSLFITQIPGIGLSALSSLYYQDGTLYTGFTDWSNGYFAAYDTTDLDVENEYEVVAPKWKYGSSSHYGSGAVKSGEYLIFAGDADRSGNATVTAVNPATGEEVSTLTIQGNARCSIVESDGCLWLTTQASKVYKLAVGTDGTLVEMASAALPSTTNASPVVTGGKVYVTGGVWGSGYLQVFDTQLNLLANAATDGPANTPTVSVVNGIPYVYFTQNAEPGALFVAKVTADNQITVSCIYTPEHSNYCMSNVIIGEDGTIYYGNDAGYIYALKAVSEDPTPEPTPTPLPTPVPPTPTIQNENRINTLETKKTITTLFRTGSQQTEANTTDTIVKKIQSEIAENKTSLTITNAPEVIEAAVFTELKKHASFRLILDFGTYTMSIKGSDITNETASLSARLVEEAGELSEEQKKSIGTYQQLKFEQDGELPGIFTIVYKLHDSLEKMTSGMLYQKEDLKNGEDITVSKAYAMFTIGKCGTYILADQSDKEAELTEEKTTKSIADTSKTETKNETAGNNKLLIMMIVAVGTIVVVGAIAGVIIRRRKEKTWEE